jgi:teichuronic acid exporter
MQQATKNSSLLRNMSWLGISELMIRITRIATAVILARTLNAHEFGVIAIAMTVQEVVQTLTRNGIGAKIVQTDSAHLNAVCNIVYRLNWKICIALFFIQCAVAHPIKLFYRDDALYPLVIALAIPYLIYPFAMVQVYLVQRQNRLGVTALANGAQVSIDNITSAVLALCGFGIWSVIIPKIIVAPLWVLFYRKLQTWRPSKQEADFPQSEILAFSMHVLGSEICATARRHIDRVLIGFFMGLDTLGIYYFAVNSGLGLSLSLASAFNTAFYPHLCAQRENLAKLKLEFKKGIKIIIALSIVMFGAQAILAPWYVPMIFGEKWTHAIPILMVLTLSGIPRPAAEACAQFLRAVNKPRIDFRWNVVFTLLMTLSILVGVQYDIETVAYAVLLSHAICIPIYVGCCWFFPRKAKSFQLIAQKV